jgi:hypothetical protein
MERLEKLVFVHYNMRLRHRTLKRKETEEGLIDLDNIFHEEDPLGEWIREREDCLLDGRDNNWIADAIAEDEALNRNNAATERRRKGKHAATTEESQESSDDDNSGDSSGSEPVHVHNDPTTTSSDQSHDQQHSYERHDHQHSGMEDTYTRFGRHDVREEPSDSGGPFDGMMSSFFGGTQISHYYPHEPRRYDGQEDYNAAFDPQAYIYLPHQHFQQQRQDEDNDDQNIPLESHRASFWW